MAGPPPLLGRVRRLVTAWHRNLPIRVPGNVVPGPRPVR
jgi:hypothetical protein